MYAKPGDWLIVQSASDSKHARRAEILSVSEGGAPPFTVRWLDTGHEGILFPGPDAVVTTAAELAALDRRAAERAAHVQDEVRRQHAGG